MRRTAGWCVVGGMVLAVAIAPPPRVAAAASLSPNSPDARPGTTITMTGDFCASGRTLSSITVSIKDQFPKGPIMTFPIDQAAAGVTQTATGFTFRYPAKTAKTYVWFTVTCSDGNTATSDSTRVTVWPPFGSLWFLSPYDTLFADPGSSAHVDVASMDCAEGSSATLEIATGSKVIASATTAVDRRAMAFDIAIPKTVTRGEYLAQVACKGVNGASIRDSHQFTVGAGAGGFPPTGGHAGLLGYAFAFVFAGGVLTAAGKHVRGQRARWRA